MLLICLAVTLFVIGGQVGHHSEKYRAMHDYSRIAYLVHGYRRTAMGLHSLLMSGGMMCAWLGTKSMPIAQSIACILLVICGIFFFGFVIVMTIVIIPRVLDILDLHELRYQFHCLKTSFRKWMWDWRYETVDMCVSYTLIGMTIASCGFVFFDVAITVIPPQLKS